MPTDTFLSPESSNIAGATYDFNNQTLQVQFKDTNTLYIYQDVPLAIWRGFKQASSKGSYFAANIRQGFEFVKA